MSATTSALPRTRAVPVRGTALLILAVGQLISPVFTSLFGGAFTTADRAGEPSITPAGYTFAIWGVIELFSVAYAIWALWDRRPDPVLRDRLALPLIVVFAGFSAWLVAAELEPTWATLVVFLIMIAGLVTALQIALHHRAAIAEWSPVGRGLLWGTLGLYTGWGSIAIWLNLTTALTGSGVPLTGPAALVGQLAILAGAAGTAVAILVWTRGLLPYAAATAWAFVGAIVGALGAGEPILAGAAAFGVVIIAVTTIITRRTRARCVRS